MPFSAVSGRPAVPLEGAVRIGFYTLALVVHDAETEFRLGVLQRGGAFPVLEGGLVILLLVRLLTAGKVLRRRVGQGRRRAQQCQAEQQDRKASEHGAIPQ
jgi:hypothetical protein